MRLCPLGCGNSKDVGVTSCARCAYDPSRDPAADEELFAAAEHALLVMARQFATHPKPRHLDAPPSPQPGASFSITAPRNDPGAAHETYTEIIFGRRRA
jgi:hypothetical protein